MRILVSFVAATGAALLMSAPPQAEVPSTAPLDAEQVLAALPAGVLLGWYGGEELPDGFTLCDGTGGTPDLVGRSPLGTADPLEIGSKTGSASHDHAAIHLRTGPARGGGGSADGWNAADMNRLASPQTTGLEHEHGVTGLVDPASNVPPSTRVMFICKR